MAEFSSPLGKKQIRNPNFRNIEVPDETMHQHMPQDHDLGGLDLEAIQKFSGNQSNEDMQAIAQAKAEHRMSKRNVGKERLNEGAKKRIEMLLGMSTTTKEVEIDGNSYGFKTLKNIEIREALISVAKFDGTIEAPFEVRKQLLARSLTMVAGLDIDQFVGSYDIEARFELLDNMDEYLLSRLYDEYVSLVAEAKKKYSADNKEQIQEVLEDLKK